MKGPILSLCVARFNDEPIAEPIVVEFGAAGGTIGRATDCTLVLPDQQRAISRVHARIEFRDGEYLLCDLGSNPSVLNQRALGGTREARLANGDRLMIGTYLLEVSIGERVAGVRSMTGLPDPLAAVKVLGERSPADMQSDPFGLGALDPLGQPAFGERKPIASGPRYAGSESDHVAPEFQAFSAPEPRVPPVPVVPHLASGRSGSSGSSGSSAVRAAQPGGIPADYDPLADALAQWESSPRPGGASGAAASAPAFASTPSQALPRAHPVHAPAPGAPVPATQHGPTGLPASLLGDAAEGAAATPFDDLLAQPAQPAQQEVFEDPTELAPVHEPAPAPAPAPAASAPAQAAVPAPQAPTHAPPPGAAATPACASASPGAREEAATPRVPWAEGDAYAALVEGLGLDPSRAPNVPPAELARLVGAMLREALRGTMGVLRARSMTRREVRLDITLIVARDNNPLKFFPDVDSALEQMLTGRGAGYLPPAQALECAFDDIESHELAVIAGMRAALAEVLGRFDPAHIEAQLKEGGMIEKVLSNRKARLWDLFVERHENVSREAQDDFQRLFGKAFNDAYEAQIDALRTARKSGRTDPSRNR